MWLLLNVFVKKIRKILNWLVLLVLIWAHWGAQVAGDYFKWCNCHSAAFYAFAQCGEYVVACSYSQTSKLRHSEQVGTYFPIRAKTHSIAKWQLHQITFACIVFGAYQLTPLLLHTVASYRSYDSEQHRRVCDTRSEHCERVDFLESERHDRFQSP